MNNSTARAHIYEEGYNYEPVCSWIAKAMPSETKQLFTWYFAAAVVNMTLSIATSCGNILILVALQKAYTLSPPSRILFRSLAVSDVCVGIVSKPLFAVGMLLISTGRSDLCRLMRYLTFISSTTLCGVSLLTMTAISLDRLLVLLSKSKYSLTVTSNRVKVVVVLFWISSISLSVLYSISIRSYFIANAVVILLSIVISAYSYSSIFLILRRRQRRRIRDQSQGQINSFQLQRELRHKSTVYSALWVHFTLAICYLPFSLLEAMAKVIGTPLPIFIAGTCTGTLIYLNSIINPFLYCGKIKEVRQAVKQIITCW
ncbi:5-hydroxytryptamine receptor 1B-like [Oculina patagonica]